MGKCLGAMEQDREVTGPSRAGAWAEVGARGEEAVLGQAQVVPACAQSAGQENRMSWEHPVSSGNARSVGRR
jgi:hypothetical protein